MPATLVDMILANLPAMFLALTALLLADAGVRLVHRALAEPGDDGLSWHWQVGGFGRPGRGWRLSAALARLLAGLALAALAAALGLSLARPNGESKEARATSVPASGSSAPAAGLAR